MPALLALLPALALGACGGGGGGDSGEKTTSTPSPGTTYAVKVPSGWTDSTGKTRTGAIRVDRLLIGPTVGGFRTNVNVIREPRREDASLDDVVKASQRQVEQAIGAKVGPGRPAALKIDGEPALSYTYRFRRSDKRLRGRQVQVFHAGQIYTVTLTSHARAAPDARRAFDSVLRSWRWR
jgi:hypothetical protein